MENHNLLCIFCIRFRFNFSYIIFSINFMIKFTIIFLWSNPKVTVICHPLIQRHE